MKKLALYFFIMMFVVPEVCCQWYYKDYNVHDVDSLSLEQLQDALANNKNDMMTSGAVVIVGGLVVGGGFLTLKTGLPDDPGFWEELLGSEIMGKIYIGLGIGIAATGVVMCLGDLGQRAEIKSAIRRNYQTAGSFRVSPALLMNNYSKSISPGISFAVTF